MDKIKDILYKYRLLVIIVCVICIIGCIYAIYQTFFTDNDHYVTSVKNGDKEIISEDSVSITKNDLYEYFLNNNGMNLTLDTAIDFICDKELDDEEALNAKIEEIKQQYIDYIGTDLASYAKENGYADEQSFIDDVITPDAKSTLLKEKYINDNYDELIKDYKVKYIKTITLDTESQALKIIEGSKDEASFNNYMNEYSGTDQGLVTKDSTILDENITKKLGKFTKDGIYSQVIKTSDSKYAVVWVYNTDKSKLKDEISSSLSEISDINQDAETFYLRKYNFDVYEPKIKEQIEEVSEDYFG
ncbi:hypothetical protein H5999_11210 [[Clostridium] spiroforme]|nr:hypothetical protein [Thomasclavelia spiroformis]